MGLKSLPFPLSHKNSRGLSQFKLLSSDTVWFLRNSSMGFGSVISLQKNTRFILSFPLLLTTFTGYRLSTADDRKSNNALRLSLKKLVNNPKNEPFELANKAFCQYLKDKLLLPSKNLDPNLVKSILIDKVNKDLCKELVDLLIVCDQGRYSPQVVNKKDTVLYEMRVLLKKIDREIT